MVDTEKYKEIWELADKLAKEELEEWKSGMGHIDIKEANDFLVKRRDVHINQMLQYEAD